MPVTNYTTVALNPSDLEEQDSAAITGLFLDWVNNEVQKVIFGPIKKQNTLRRSPTFGPPTPDDLARIESEARELTRKLIGMGLHPPLVKDLVVGQLANAHRTVEDASSWRRDVVSHRSAAVARQWSTHAVLAGACQAIADWLDDNTK